MFLFPPSTQHVIQVELAAIITHSVVIDWFLKATSPWTLLMCFFRFLIFSCYEILSFSSWLLALNI